MNTSGYIDPTSSIEHLLSQCKENGNIYIYGAGQYGKYCSYLMNDNSLSISGFITTNKEVEECIGIPVFSLDEYIGISQKDDIIIPGFLGFSVNFVKSKFERMGVSPIVIGVDPKTIADYLLIESLQNIKRENENSFVLQDYEKANWKNILIIRLDAIGDLVCSTAFIRELRHNFTNANITLVTNRNNIAIVEHCPYLDRIIPYTLSNEYGEDLVYDLRHFECIKNRVNNEIRKNDSGSVYDVAILLAPVLEGRNAVESFTYMIQCGAKNRIGYLYGNNKSDCLRYLYLKEIFSALPYIEEPLHETDFQLMMLNKIGLTVIDKKNELWIDETSRGNARDRLFDDGVDENDILIAIGIIGSIERRNWNTENYRRLISLIGDRYSNVKWVVFGGSDAQKAAKDLIDIKNVIDYSGKLDLRDSLACIEQCDLYVGANTGLMHIAATLRKPCITIYSVLMDVSPWDGNGPIRFGARDTVSIDLIPPPGLDGCHGSCKMKKPHCVNRITPEEVYREIVKLIDSRAVSLRGSSLSQ